MGVGTTRISTVKLSSKVYLYQLIKRQSCHHMETGQLICRANQLNGFYMILTLAFHGLIKVFAVVAN